jgi:hypothetical protein
MEAVQCVELLPWMERRHGKEDARQPAQAPTAVPAQRPTRVLAPVQAD